MASLFSTSGDPADRCHRVTTKQIPRGEHSLARAAGNSAALSRRIAQLEREWDADRAVQAAAAVAALAGLALGTTVGRKWLALPAAAGGFLLQHAARAWCPPFEALRRMGFRTAAEIDRERYALKALRGDFQNLPDSPAAGDRAPFSRVLHAVAR